MKSTEQFLNDAITDINTFLEKVLCILFGKYWKIQDEVTTTLERILVEAMLKCIFKNGVYHHLISIIKLQTKEEDEKFVLKLNELKNITLRHLNVKKILQLEGNPNPYHEAIELFKNLYRLYTMEEKVELISKVISQISECVKIHYRNSNIHQDDLIVYVLFLF